MTARYESSVEAVMIVEVRGGLLRRTQLQAVEVTLVDLSVTGAAVWMPSGPAAKNFVIGRNVDLTIGNDSGLVKIRRVHPDGDGILIGVEFVALSAGFQQRVYDTVGDASDADGDTSSFWHSRR